MTKEIYQEYLDKWAEFWSALPGTKVESHTAKYEDWLFDLYVSSEGITGMQVFKNKQPVQHTPVCPGINHIENHVEKVIKKIKDGYETSEKIQKN